MPTLAPKLPVLHPFAGGYPGRGGQYLPTDPDATDYLSRLAEADGASVEVGIAQAIEAFITGCKADNAGYAGDPTRSNWDAIKSACIMCGARTLSGALVSLRQYGPDLADINNLPTPTIADLAGSVGAWDAPSRTASNSAFGTNATYPQFTFNFGAVAGTEYRVTGRFSGDLSSIYGFRADLGPGSAYYVDIDPVTGEFSKTISFLNSNMQLLMRGDLGPSSVRIESLSIKEVINDATNVANNFVEADYSRSGTTPGLKGNASTKYLDTNLNNTSVGRDDRHVSIYRSYGNPAGGTHYQIGAYSSTPAPAHITAVRPLGVGSCAMYGGGSNGPSVPSPAAYETGFLGVSRAVSTGFDYRTPSSGSIFFSSSNSNAPQDQNFFVFTTSLNGNSPFSPTDGRLAFYSVGAALDLAKMDTRTTNLVNAIKFHSLTGLLPNDYDPDTIAYIVAAIEAGGTL